MAEVKTEKETKPIIVGEYEIIGRIKILSKRKIAGFRFGSNRYVELEISKEGIRKKCFASGYTSCVKVNSNIIIQSAIESLKIKFPSSILEESTAKRFYDGCKSILSELIPTY